MDKFKGETVHSHNYREPDAYAGKRVLCVGGGASGTDISIELSGHAKQVNAIYFSLLKLVFQNIYCHMRSKCITCKEQIQ